MYYYFITDKVSFWPAACTMETMVAKSDYKTLNQLGFGPEYSIQHFTLHIIIKSRVNYWGE